MSIERKPFGVLGTGDEPSLYVLRSGPMTATVTDYGAILVSLLVPDRNGVAEDVTLGFSTLSGYAGRHPYFGATVGRFANRIGKARFTLDGKEYALAANNGENHLHGGIKGFDRCMWSAEILDSGERPAVRFHRRSPDGEEGYPGDLDVSVRYSLSPSGTLSIRYEAGASSRTIVNLTNHSYFNLRGEGRGSILDHRLRLDCSRYLPVGADLIPTGERAPVDGTPFDFRKPTVIGSRIGLVPGGYDHCYILDRVGGGAPVPFAEAHDPVSGRTMSVSTTMPGCQFYSGNFLSGISGKRGSMYDRHAGFCLETQYFPDAPNRPDFPSPILDPGLPWVQETLFGFSA